MTITAQAVQLSNTLVQLTWQNTDPDPTLGYEIQRTVNAGLPKVLAIGLIGDTVLFADDLSADGLAVGDLLDYKVTDNDTALSGTVFITLRDLDVPFTYGAVDALQSTIRYTTLEEVRRRLGLDPSDTTRDDLITQSAIAAEVQIDQMNARSFPDTGSNPQWPGVPSPIASWATDAAVAVYKRADAPFGTAGSDNWIGTLDVTDEVERALRRNPLAVGYKIAWGIG